MLPEILQREKLFSLLHEIDINLAAEVQARGCPTVGGRCTEGLICANPVAAPLACPKHSPYAIVFAVVARDADGAPYLHRCFSWDGGFTGAGWSWSSPHFASNGARGTLSARSWISSA